MDGLITLVPPDVLGPHTYLLICSVTLFVSTLWLIQPDLQYYSVEWVIHFILNCFKAIRIGFVDNTVYFTLFWVFVYLFSSFRFNF